MLRHGFYCFWRETLIVTINMSSGHHRPNPSHQRASVSALASSAGLAQVPVVFLAQVSNSREEESRQRDECLREHWCIPRDIQARDRSSLVAYLSPVNSW